MKDHKTQDIRNVCLLGSSGTGKTSLAEIILHNLGVSDRWGKVEDGTTVSDYTHEEIDRGASLYRGCGLYLQAQT